MPMAEYSKEHAWVGAATIHLDPKQAKRAVLRHSVRILVAGEIKIDILETYCAQCRRPWDDVSGDLCEAAVSNEHLRGGPIGERKKRKHNHNCDALGCTPRKPNDDEGEDGEPIAATG